MTRLILKLILICVAILATDYAVDAYLKDGLNRYYGFTNGARILCVGHSRSDHAIDKKRLEQGLKVPVAKYAVAGMDAFDRLAMIRHYFGEHPHQTKIVVYDVDFFTFNGRTYNPEHMKQYKQLFPFMGNENIDGYLKSRSTWSEYYSQKYIRSLRYNDPKVFARAVINHFKTAEIPGDYFDEVSYRKNLVRNGNPYANLTINPATVKCFEETLALLKSKNVKTVLLFLPIVDLERDRIDKAYRDKVVGMFRSYDAQDPDVFFIDHNQMFEHRRELFYDPLHFNKHGQALATDGLVGVIKPIM
ncbi:hypothetical protein [Geobacter sp. AOG2]|uniref:hypothetical protein n=1 Tax=Geobacter sp. AOG2 TaxID=1566347 RepID=UPI001CC37CAA|nr:hypothetical protein [Geobacter sp. AOG2]GFE60486.1 hypothetical protein AOG2_10740 [Geobacter sp. AOG2]